MKASWLPRDLTIRISWLLDNLLPPVIRDSRIFMMPLFQLAYGRDLARQVIAFKQQAHTLSLEAYASLYAAYARCPLGRRYTDLNAACLRRISQLIYGSSVLDAGCGRGALITHLQGSVPGLVFTGSDVVMPHPAERPANARWIEANLEALPFPDRAFDTVLCTHTLEHVQHLPAALKELRRVMRQRLIVVLPRQRSYRYSFDLHLRFYPYRHSIQADFPADRTSIELVDGDWLIVEDRQDPGCETISAS